MLALRFLLRAHATPSPYVVTRPASVFTRAFHQSHSFFSTAEMVEKVNTTERLAELRKRMKEHQIDVYRTPAQHIQLHLRW